MRSSAELIARHFYEHYDAAPRWLVRLGDTGERSRVPWEEMPDANKQAMIAAVRGLLDEDSDA